MSPIIISSRAIRSVTLCVVLALAACNEKETGTAPAEAPKPVAAAPAPEAPKPVVEAPPAEAPKPTAEVAAKPVAEPKEKAAPTPVQEKIAKAPAPVKEKVAKAPAPVKEKVVKAPAPVKEKVVKAPAPVKEKVVKAPAPVKEKVVKAPAPVKEKVAKAAPAPKEEPVEIAPAPKKEKKEEVVEVAPAPKKEEVVEVAPAPAAKEAPVAAAPAPAAQEPVAAAAPPAAEPPKSPIPFEIPKAGVAYLKIRFINNAAKTFRFIRGDFYVNGDATGAPVKTLSEGSANTVTVWEGPIPAGASVLRAKLSYTGKEFFPFYYLGSQDFSQESIKNFSPKKNDHVTITVTASEAPGATKLMEQVLSIDVKEESVSVATKE